MPTIKTSDLTEVEINYFLATRILKYQDQGFTVFITPNGEKCKGIKSRGKAPCEFEELTFDFAKLWNPVEKVFGATAPQVVPTDRVASLRYILTLNLGESFESDDAVARSIEARNPTIRSSEVCTDEPGIASEGATSSGEGTEEQSRSAPISNASDGLKGT